MPAARFIHLRRPPVVSLTDEPFVPGDAGPEVERRWEALRRANPAFFDGRVLQVLSSRGLERAEVDRAEAGDIIAVTGIDRLRISDTICDPAVVEALPALTVDEPTVSMGFQVNTSPFAGRDGKYLTSRQIRERLDRELIHNVALSSPASNIVLIVFIFPVDHAA